VLTHFGVAAPFVMRHVTFGWPHVTLFGVLDRVSCSKFEVRPAEG